jgi:hypothetical protein
MPPPPTQQNNLKNYKEISKYVRKIITSGGQFITCCQIKNISDFLPHPGPWILGLAVPPLPDRRGGHGVVLTAALDILTVNVVAAQQ